MKKLISVFVLAVMVASVLLAVAGCSDNSGMRRTANSSALLAEIEELKDRVEDLENKNNVFWTDKAEYSEHETMTIYFKDTAVFNVAMAKEPALAGGIEYINTSFILTSLVSDIAAASIVGSSYVEWNNGVCFADKEPGEAVCKQNIETSFNLYYYGASDAISMGTEYSIVICIPGTPFELARFINVSMEK